MKRIIVSFVFCLMAWSVSAQIYIGLTDRPTRRIAADEPYDRAKIFNTFGQPREIKQWEGEYYAGLNIRLAFDGLVLLYADGALLDYTVTNNTYVVSINNQSVRVGDNVMSSIERFVNGGDVSVERRKDDLWVVYIGRSTLPVWFEIDPSTDSITAIYYHE